MNTTLQKEKQIDTSIRWFCTIFKKNNNRAITTFNTVWEFTEKHAIAYAILNWILWEIKPKDKEKAQKDLLSYIENKLDPEIDKDKIETLKKGFDVVERDYRFLIWK